jgi:hypothetical protein
VVDIIARLESEIRARTETILSGKSDSVDWSEKERESNRGSRETANAGGLFGGIRGTPRKFWGDGRSEKCEFAGGSSVRLSTRRRKLPTQFFTGGFVGVKR